MPATPFDGNSRVGRSIGPPDDHPRAVDRRTECRGCGDRIAAKGVTAARRIDAVVNGVVICGRVLSTFRQSKTTCRRSVNRFSEPNRNPCHSTTSQHHSTLDEPAGSYVGRSSLVPHATHSSRSRNGFQQSHDPGSSAPTEGWLPSGALRPPSGDPFRFLHAREARISTSEKPAMETQRGSCRRVADRRVATGDIRRGMELLVAQVGAGRTQD